METEEAYSGGLAEASRDWIKSFSEAWDTVENWIAGFLLCSSAAIISYLVFTRYLLGYSYASAEELSRYLMIWGVYVGASYAVKSDSHVKCDFLLIYLSEGKKLTLDTIAVACGLIFTIILTYSGFQLIATVIMVNEISPTPLQLPMWIPRISVPIGGCLLTLRLFQRLRHNIVRLISNSDKPS